VKMKRPDFEEDRAAAETPRGPTPVTIYGTGIALPETPVRVGDSEQFLKNFNREIAKRSYEEHVKKYFRGETVYLDKDGKGPAFYLAEAGIKALGRAGLEMKDIDSIVLATCSAPDQSRGLRGDVLAHLGVSEFPIRELNAACTGFLDALSDAKDRAQNRNERVLVLGGDTFKSTWVNPADYLMVALFGDGAAAAVIGPCEQGFGLKEDRIVTNADWRHDAEKGPDGYAGMDAKVLGARIPTAFPEQFMRGCKQNGFDPQETIAIPHHANGRLLEKILEELKIPSDHMVNVFHKYGNTASGSVGIALHHAFRDGMLKRGTNAMLFGGGAGFNYGYMGLTADRALPEQIEYRVLFVDDDQWMVQQLAKEMASYAQKDTEFNELFKFVPLIAYSGRQGLDIMIDDRTINQVVTDFRMEADFSGGKLVETLKRRARNIGYTLVTGYADENRDEIAGVGFQEIIRKPAKPEEVWSSIRKGAYALRNRDVNID